MIWIALLILAGLLVAIVLHAKTLRLRALQEEQWWAMAPEEPIYSYTDPTVRIYRHHLATVMRARARKGLPS
ncbi:hypothetical protein [Deinococcus misasensis]|uniref:hypothetical protein n=1 Tax=Deinococcus misasensis TaxID=392413 RepID=UPI000550D5EF|nr:hypothetical protein [Deinococcus misasensis]